MFDPVRDTIGEMIRKRVEEHSEDHAVVHTERGERFTYRLLSLETDRAASGFISSDIEKGDRVAIIGGNLSEWIICFLALAKIGVVAVPIDPAVEGDELRYFLVNSGCRGVVALKETNDREFFRTLMDLKKELSLVDTLVSLDQTEYQDMIPWAQLVSMGEGVKKETLSSFAREVRPEDPAAIMYTSGTTGRPKGVVIDHSGLVNKSLSSIERQGLGPDDRLCLFFPLFHMFGNTCVALSGLLAGATIVMPCSLFDKGLILSAVEKEACTAIYGTPGMIIDLMEQPGFRREQWVSLKKGTLGGAPCPVELMKKIVADMGISDITVGYGITEACSWITMTMPHDPVEMRCSTIGKSLPCCEVKIGDPVTGRDLPADSRGELCTRGFLMKGYFGMPSATEAVMDAEGWFHTGDLGEMDEKGYVKIAGRIKDVIERDGVRIYPARVEDVIYRLEGISQVQVFGFPHPEKGQEMAAWMTVKDGSKLCADEVKSHVRRHLPAALIPDYFKIVEELPMTRTGKALKFKMAEMAEKEYL